MVGQFRPTFKCFSNVVLMWKKSSSTSTCILKGLKDDFFVALGKEAQICSPIFHASMQHQKLILIIEPLHKKTNKMLGQKQRREADQRFCFCCMDSSILLLSKSKIPSLYPSSATVQHVLCWTWPEPKLLVFSRKCSISIK